MASTPAWDHPAPAETVAGAAPLRLTPADRAWLVGLLAGVVALVLLWALVVQQPDRRLHLRVLDVGQGDALLLSTPAGHTILVDGGPDAVLLKLGVFSCHA